MVAMSALLIIGSLIAGILYGPPTVHNPFLILGGYFTLRMAVQIFTFENGRKSKRLDLLENSIIFSAMVVTAVLLLSFCIPEGGVNLTGLFVTGVASWLVGYGVTGAVVSGLGIWADRRDSKEFREEMKEVAEKARVEEALVADLTEFLADADPTNSDSDVER